MVDNFTCPYEILSPESMHYDFNFKVIVIGNSNVGKSSLTYRGTKNKFTETTSSTVGYDYFEFTIVIKDNLNKQSILFNEFNDFELPEGAKDKTLKLSIWDTCGQEQYRSLISNFFHSSSMALIVYSIEERNSFESINDWVKQVKNLAATNCKFILIGNKNDINDDKRRIDYEEGHTLALENNMAFFTETSAKTGEHVKELFVNTAYLLYYEYLQSKLQPTIDEEVITNLIQPQTSLLKKKACC